MLRVILAVLHLLALGIGLGAVFSRARALNGLATEPDALTRAFAADAWWGAAAVLWLSTGVWRALAGTEKVSSYYWSNHVFMAKMGLFVLVVLLEIWPMMTLIAWRRTGAQVAPVIHEARVAAGRRIARISDVQTMLLIAIVTAAVLMARGYGART